MTFWKRDTPPPAAVPEPEPASEKTAAELMVESVRLLRESLKLEAEEAMAPVDQALKADEARLAEAKRTADMLGLREALGYAIETLRPYHSWIKLDDKHRTPGVGIYISAGDTRKVDRTEHTGLLMTIEGRPYVLKWHRTPGYHSGDPYGSASFETEDQEVLFSIEYTASYRYEMEQVSPGAVTKIVVGEWVHDLVRLSERLRAAHDLKMTEMRASWAAETAKDI